MDHEDSSTTSERWAWRERKVDPTARHFELRYGDAADSDRNAWVLVARVGLPVNGVFGVEFTAGAGGSPSASMMSAVVEELDFYLVTKGEPDPWAYARYHCGTSANVYSFVHWSFQEGGRKKGISSRDDKGGTGLKPGEKAAMTRSRKVAGAKAAATRKHRAAGKKAAKSRKRSAAAGKLTARPARRPRSR